MEATVDELRNRDAVERGGCHVESRRLRRDWLAAEVGGLLA